MKMVIRSNQHERILLSPSIRETSSVDVGVRLERLSLIEKFRLTSAGLAIVRSDRERFLDDLLRKYKALRVIVRFKSENSNRFPVSTLDHVPSIFNVGINTSPTAGSAGTSVSAIFVNARQKDIDNEFENLLKELMANRILFAPIASLKLKRLHRHVRRRTTISNYTELSIMFPSDGGAAVSTEGMTAFMSIASSTIWSLGDPDSWSSLMLGDSPTTTNYPRNHRVMWIDVQSSLTCHDDDLHSANESDLCRQSISLGMQYHKIVPLAVRPIKTTPSSVAISLSDVMPVSDKSSSLRKELFVDSLTVDLAVANSSGIDIQWNHACDSGPPMDRHFVSCRLDQPIPLDATLVTLANVSVDQSNDDPFWIVHTNALRPAGIANRGTLVSTLVNNHPACTVKATVETTIPSTVVPIFQTLSVSVAFVNGTYSEIPFKELSSHIVRFMDNGSTLLSFRHSLPPESRMTISIDYDPFFGSLDYFPGDLNRGIEVPPLIARFAAVDRCQEILPVELVSNTLLIITPLPDMSMPFNVLSLSCTLYAFIIGSFINLLVRKASSTIKSQLYPPTKSVSKVKQIKEKIISIFTKIRNRLKR